MIKSLLLGSAASLLAVAVTQAADLPVKAKPVEYAKVCSLYGAGFFYIPGTDTCLKIGGMVRADYGVNASGSHTQYWNLSAGSQYNRATNDFQSRVRSQISFDARTQTEYGTLRSFSRLGMQYSSTNGSTIDGQIYFDRAFIQLAGFTFGKSLSFFDAYSGTYASYQTLVGASHTTNGQNVAAYTAKFGNGFSATIAIEDAVHRRSNGVYSADDNYVTPGASFTSRYAGQQVPDIIGNLRVDQAWGSAQLSVATRQVRATYYADAGGNYLEDNGYPSDKWGFAVQGAAQFKLPWAAGDRFTIQGIFTEGMNYYALGKTTQSFGIYSGSTVFEGFAPDAIYAAGTSLNLTKVFGFNAGLEHYWTPGLRTSVFGSYASIDFNDAATTLVCGNAANCNPDWNMYQAGTRTTWSPVKNLDVGLELVYAKFESSQNGLVYAGLAPGNGKPKGDYVAKDQDVFSGMIRVQRNFWP
jgi:hypothetical protein